MFSGIPSSLQLLLPAQPQQRSHTRAPPTRLRKGSFDKEAARWDQSHCAAAALLSGRALLSRKLLTAAERGAAEALGSARGTRSSCHAGLRHVAGGCLAVAPNSSSLLSSKVHSFSLSKDTSSPYAPAYPKSHATRLQASPCPCVSQQAVPLPLQSLHKDRADH